MDIDNLIDIFKVEVLKLKPELNDFNQGSVLYTLARAAAATVNEVYIEIEKLKESSLFIDSAVVNENLLSSINVNLSKLPGSPATGYVLISNIDSITITVPAYTVLTDPISLNQYLIKEDVYINSLTEVQAPVVSLSNNVTANIPAGRNLINVDFPKLVFSVGTYRNIDNTLYGDLTGAVSEENNLDYYNRIKERLLNLRLTQKQVLYDYLLSESDITNVYIETLTGGLIIVWVNSNNLLTTTRLTELNTSIEDYLPIGTYSTVKQLLSKSINITIQVFEETNLTIDNYIKDIARVYIDSLKPSDTLSLVSLRNLIVVKTGLIVKIINPSSDVSLANNEIFTINSLEILNVS